jgi:hypothetical protein
MQVQYNTVQESERTTNPEEDTMKKELFIREMEIKRKYKIDAIRLRTHIRLHWITRF